MLEIKDLHASTDGNEILRGIDLKVEAGKVHAIMGPNGSGKSTLSKVLAGHPDYEVTQGGATFLGNNLLEMAPDERARSGLFLGFQYPVEIPGVNNAEFMRLAYNARRRHLGQEELDPLDFDTFLDGKMGMLDMAPKFKERGLNESFSGGEKKRNEILQMAVLDPTLAILDETDSGLDIDALRVVARGINLLRNKNNAIVLITHYQRLLEYVEPDFVHVLNEGRITRSGGKELALELEEKGYETIGA